MSAEIIRAGFEEEAGASGEIRAVFDLGNRRGSVCFRSDDVVLSAHPEALVAAGILPAMRSGKDLQLDSALDLVFEKNLKGIQDLFEMWGPSYRRVNILSGMQTPARTAQDRKRVGLFFSGGVDSFYSLLENQDEVTDLIFVHGFDIRPEDRETCRRAEESIRRVGKAFGKRVIKVETNVRSLLAEYGEWGERTHGAAMAVVAHLLGDEFAQIYIAASDTEGLLSPWGSHPHMDPLWSSSRLEFVHHGCDASRPEKLRRVASSEPAIQNLRVCWKNRKGALNCGRCEKCIRTMIGLHVMGVTNFSNVFSEPLRVWRVMRIKIPHPNVATGQFYNLAELKKEPRFLVLYWALRIGFLRSHLRRRMQAWGRRCHG